jgi:hypothetical protein
MSFNLLSNMEDTELPDSEMNNSDLDYEYYIDLIKESYTELFNYIETKPEFNKTFGNQLYKLLKQYYDYCNELEDILENESIIEKNSIMNEISRGSKPLYILLDKNYSNQILSRKGFQLLEDTKLLEYLDIYYNMYIHTKNMAYLLVAFKNSSNELLESIDEFDSTHSKYMEYKDKLRYENYLKTIYWMYKKEDILDLDAIILIGKLKKICEKDSDIQLYFNNIFKDELRMIKDNWYKLKEYFD